MARSPAPAWFTVVLALFLLAVLGSCNTRVSPDGAASTPTRLAVVTAAAPMGPPAPTRAAPTHAAPTAVPPTLPAGQRPTYGPVAWTLTILHTGEVYGDVLPCG